MTNKAFFAIAADKNEVVNFGYAAKKRAGRAIDFFTAKNGNDILVVDTFNGGIKSFKTDKIYDLEIGVAK